MLLEKYKYKRIKNLILLSFVVDFFALTITIIYSSALIFSEYPENYEKLLYTHLIATSLLVILKLVVLIKKNHILRSFIYIILHLVSLISVMYIQIHSVMETGFHIGIVYASPPVLLNLILYIMIAFRLKMQWAEGTMDENSYNINKKVLLGMMKVNQSLNITEAAELVNFSESDIKRIIYYLIGNKEIKGNFHENIFKIDADSEDEMTRILDSFDQEFEKWSNSEKDPISSGKKI